MLILTRRTGETVMIGDDVTLTILGVQGNQVRIGINAPKNIAIHRKEIYLRIKNQQAGRSDPAEPARASAHGGKREDERKPTAAQSAAELAT